MSTQIPCKEIYKELFDVIKGKPYKDTEEEKLLTAVSSALMIMEAAKKENIDITAETMTLSEYTKLLVRLVK